MDINGIYWVYLGLSWLIYNGKPSNSENDINIGMFVAILG
jgi:hypothetical protein